MAIELLIAPKAELATAEGFVCYEGRRIGLGEEFLSSVEACTESIRRQPGMYSAVWRTYRRALIRRSPYAVFYERGENAVTVYSVFHTSRDREKMA